MVLFSSYLSPFSPFWFPGCEDRLPISRSRVRMFTSTIGAFGLVRVDIDGPARSTAEHWLQFLVASGFVHGREAPLLAGSLAVVDQVWIQPAADLRRAIRSAEVTPGDSICCCRMLRHWPDGQTPSPIDSVGDPGAATDEDYSENPVIAAAQLP
jgi:hypothetical protein